MADERKTARRKAITGNPRAGKLSTSVVTRGDFMRDLKKVAAKEPKK
jgi:hypothetical protein